MRRISVLVLVALICLPLALAAQTTVSQVSGTVHDPSGAAIPGAQVQITNVNTSAVRTTTTSSSGYYVFASLPIGPYKLQVSKQGFTTYVQSGIVLQVNTNPTINVQMQIGAVTQTVQVSANAAMVETQSSAGLGQVIQPEQVVNLPLNGREATQLIALSGAAVNTAGQGGIVNNLDYPSAVSYAVAGSQGNATNYYLNGALNMDFRTNVGLPLPFPDALEEFKVQSSALPADSGARPGGTVNAVVKSGTNQFHGDAFDYLRNTAMDALVPTFSSLPTGSGSTPGPDNLKRNQYGGTIGGPIIKNKIFAFYGFQGTQERVLQAPSNVIVPTTDALAGDFSTMFGPQCLNKSTSYLNSQYTVSGEPFVIQSQYMDTPSAKVANYIVTHYMSSLLSRANACGQASFQTHASDNEYQNVARVDWQRTQSDTIFGSYFLTNFTLQPNFDPTDILVAGNPGLHDRAQNFVLGDTHIFSASTISQLRFSFGRTATVRSAAAGIPTLSQIQYQALGTSNLTSPVNNYTGQNFIFGYFNLIEPGYPGYDYENIFGISETVNITHGAHQVAFGADWEHVQMNDDGQYQMNAGTRFSSGGGSRFTGDALVDFVTGNVDQLHQGNGQLGRDSQNIPSLFFQDSWKLRPTFQVNLGLRWDPFFPQYNKYGQVSDFSLAGYLDGTKSQIFSNAPPGVTFSGDPGFHGNSDTNNQGYNFAPRFGFVWDPGGQGRESIRGGYGIFYNTSVLWNTMHVVLNPPWGQTLTTNPAGAGTTVTNGGGLANPYYNYAYDNGAGPQLGNPFPSPSHPPSNFPFPVDGTYVFEDQNIKPAYTQQWNLSFQKQFGADWMVSATYLGSKGTKEWLGYKMNPSTVISAGMTAPGIISTAGMTGISGPCTLNYGGSPVTLDPCNSTSAASLQARSSLVLANPTAGPLFGGGITEEFSNGNSSYNGLLLSLQHRMSRDFSIMTNYTWSHCLDDGAVGQDIGNDPQNPANRRAEWGNCSFDRRQIYNLSLVTSMPQFHSRLLQQTIGNWQGSGIFTVHSGAWLNVTDGQDISMTNVGGDRPVQIANPFAAGNVGGCTNPYGVKSIHQWFNPCAFQTAAPGTYGTVGRNSLLGPGNWNLDLSIWKTFPMTERFNLEFRAEAFNVFNHLQIGDPNTNLNQGLRTAVISSTVIQGGTASQATGAGASNQRILQVALKLTF